MTLLSEQVERIQFVLQETDTTPSRHAIVIAAHQECMQALARADDFSQIRWINALANTALYTLPDPVVNIDFVLYNERILRYVTEGAIDRRFHGWEELSGEPVYWTTDNQGPNVIRIIPAPTRTGSTIPVIPSPLVQDMRDNLVVFHTEDVSPDIVDAGDTLPTLLDRDDLLVWHTARMLAERETTDQNLPVAQLCGQLEALWKRQLGFV